MDGAAADADLARHRAAFEPVSDCPIREDGHVVVLAGGMTALRAMWAAMEAAATEIVLEFYTFEDVAVDGWRSRHSSPASSPPACAWWRSMTASAPTLRPTGSSTGCGRRVRR